jgi:thiol-disulfide isomerase/thioredoxin
MNKISVLFYGRKSKTIKDGQLPIYMRITVDGCRFEASTQRYITPEKWSPSHGRVKGNSEEARSFTPVSQFEKGKIYLLEFSGTWCHTCRKTFAEFLRVADKYKDRTKTVTIFCEEPQDNSAANIVE